MAKRSMSEEYMEPKMKIESEGKSVEITIQSRMYPDSDDWADGNWLSAEIEIKTRS